MAAQDFTPLFEKYGSQYNVDPALLAAVAQQESGGNANTPPSPQGALGLMQLMPRTAKSLGVDPHDPDQAVNGAARLLSEAMDRNGNVADAVAEYHGGPNRKIWGPKTRAYREAVLGRYQGQSGSSGSDTMPGSTGDDDLLSLARGDAPKAAPTASAPSDAQTAPTTPAATEDSPDDLLSLARGDAPKPTGKPGPNDSDLPIGETGSYATKGQKDAYEKLIKAHLYDAAQPSGSERNPRYLVGSDNPNDVKDGEYYVDQKGQYLRKGGTLESDPNAGFFRGIGDMVQTVGNAASPVIDPNHESELGNYLEGNRMVYGAQHGGDPVSGFGRLVGQVAATGVPVGGLEVAGAKLLPEGLNLGGRLLARSGIGAGAGAAAAGLTSASTPDVPLAQQLETGAVGGVLLSHLGPVVGGIGRWAGKSLRDLTQPLTEGGRQQLAENLISKFGDGAPTTGNAREIIPGSQPTLAQATANPGIATLERTVRLSRPTPFAERAAQNTEARAGVMGALKGDQTTIDLMTADRNAQLRDARTNAFDQATPATSHPLVGAIDAALQAPEAHMDDVSRPLQALRDKIVQPPPETTPAQTAAFSRQIAQTFGADAPALTPEVMSAAKSRLGDKFEEIAGKTNVQWDDRLRGHIGQIIQDTAQVVPESQIPPLFKQLDNIASTANDGREISGASYQALTKRGAPLSSLQGSSDPTIRNAANRIRDALDDALERNLSAKGGSESVGKDVDIKGHGPPERGLAAANLMEDGTAYVGKPNSLHFQVAEEFPPVHGNEIADTGFVTPQGKYLNRKEAAQWVKDNEHPIRPSENMGNGLDAIDYKDQVPTSKRSGDESPLEQLRSARLQYKNLKTVESALKSAGPDRQVSPQAVLSAVKRNFGNYAYKGGGPLGDAAEAAVREEASRGPVVESDPRQLFGMRESMSSKIDSLEKQGTDSAQSAADHLRTVRDRLDDTIGASAPGYHEYLALAHQTGEPIAALKFLQAQNVTDAKGNITLGRMDQLMKRIDTMRAKAGSNPAKLLSPDTLQHLQAIHADLLRESNSGLGAPANSHTAQHMVTGNIAENMNVPLAVGAGALLHHPLVGPALGVGKLFYGAKKEQVLDALANKLLQPELPMRNVTPGPGPVRRAVGRAGSAVVPVAGGILANRLVNPSR